MDCSGSCAVSNMSNVQSLLGLLVSAVEVTHQSASLRHQVMSDRPLRLESSKAPPTCRQVARVVLPARGSALRTHAARKKRRLSPGLEATCNLERNSATSRGIGPRMPLQESAMA